MYPKETCLCNSRLGYRFTNVINGRGSIPESKDSYIFFGEALVQLGVISKEEVVLYLKELNNLRLQSQDQRYSA